MSVFKFMPQEIFLGFIFLVSFISKKNLKNCDEVQLQHLVKSDLIVNLTWRQDFMNMCSSALMNVFPKFIQLSTASKA